MKSRSVPEFSAQDKILDEELHHPLLVDPRVAEVGADLDLEALLLALEGLDELHFSKDTPANPDDVLRKNPENSPA